MIQKLKKTCTYHVIIYKLKILKFYLGLILILLLYLLGTLRSIINKLKLLNKNFKIIIPFSKTKIIKIENANK